MESSGKIVSAREVKCQSAADRKRGGERKEAVGEIAGAVFEVPDDVRADEAADIADRVHQRDAAGRGAAA